MNALDSATTINAKNTIVKLMLLAILCTPLMGMYEYAALLEGSGLPIDAGKVYSPWYLKGIKDGLLIMILLVFFAGAWFKQITLVPLRAKWFKMLLFFLWIGLLIALVAYHPFVAIAGLRAVSSLFLFLIGYYILSSRDWQTLAKVVLAVAILECLLGFTHLFWAGATRTFFGLSARPSGTFGTSTSLAHFLVLSLMFLFMFHFSRLVRWICAPLIFTIIFSISSFSAMLTIGFIFTYFVHRKLRDLILYPAFLMSFAGGLVLLLYFMPSITNRADIWDSLTMRIQVFKNLFDTSALCIPFGRGLGVGSNTIRTLGDVLGINSQQVFPSVSFMAESAYLSLFFQVGFFGLLCFILMNAKALLFLHNSAKHRDEFFHMGVIILGMIISFTTITHELFPVNWLYFASLGYVYRIKFDALKTNQIK